MAIKIAINGFGRIGRLTFRKVFGDSKYEVVAINDLTSPDMLGYLLKYDSVQGPFRDHTVENDEKSLTVDGIQIPVFSEADPSKLPWSARPSRWCITATSGAWRTLRSSKNCSPASPAS